MTASTALERVPELCLALPDTFEKISHVEPTWFAKKKVFVMFANNHHGDGRIAISGNAPRGVQPALIAADEKTFFTPPYVGVGGWSASDSIAARGGRKSRRWWSRRTTRRSRRKAA
jgi:hypothetical protein